MSNEFQPNSIDAELQTRLTALVLGEASEFERAQLFERMEERPELQKYYQWLLEVHEDLIELGSGEFPFVDPSWKLSSERRAQMLATLDGQTSISAPAKESVQLSKKVAPRSLSAVIWIAATAASVLLLTSLTLSSRSMHWSSTKSSANVQALALSDDEASPRYGLNVEAAEGYSFQRDFDEDRIKINALPQSSTAQKSSTAQNALDSIRSTIVGQSVVVNGPLGEVASSLSESTQLGLNFADQAQGLGNRSTEFSKAEPHYRYQDSFSSGGMGGGMGGAGMGGAGMGGAPGAGAAQVENNMRGDLSLLPDLYADLPAIKAPEPQLPPVASPVPVPLDLSELRLTPATPAPATASGPAVASIEGRAIRSKSDQVKMGATAPAAEFDFGTEVQPEWMRQQEPGRVAGTRQVPSNATPGIRLREEEAAIGEKKSIPVEKLKENQEPAVQELAESLKPTDRLSRLDRQSSAAAPKVAKSMHDRGYFAQGNPQLGKELEMLHDADPATSPGKPQPIDPSNQSYGKQPALAGGSEAKPEMLGLANGNIATNEFFGIPAQNKASDGKDLSKGLKEQDAKDGIAVDNWEVNSAQARGTKSATVNSGPAEPALGQSWSFNNRFGNDGQKQRDGEDSSAPRVNQSLAKNDFPVKGRSAASDQWFEEAAKKRISLEGLHETAAESEPFSTFSLHVSDVSFKTAYAALMQNQWPDASSVRLEDFVNAFDYHDPLPTMDEQVACQIEQASHPFFMQRNLLRVAMRTAASGRAQNTPLRLTLVLDNSGSMERPDRRQTVRRALETLVQQLSPQDQLTLISFANTPRLIADQVNGANASSVVGALESLPSEGGTNIESALRLAMEKALEQKVVNAQNRVVLLTDGAVNLGDAEPESLAKWVVRMRDAGLAFDAAGISAQDLNDNVLEALTRQGDGRYYLLDSIESASTGFSDQIAGALRPAAKNVKVQVEFNPQRVGHYRLLGFEKHRLNQEDFRNDQVDAAELAAAEAGVAMYQFEAKPDGVGDIGSVSVRFQDLKTGNMVERRWPIPYESNPPRIDQANPSLQMATAAVMFAANLRGEPLGDSVDLKALTALISNLPESMNQNERVVQLRTMIARARQMRGE